MNLSMFTRIEKMAYLFLILIFGLGLYFSFTDPQYFNEDYAREDGFVEYGTALLLFFSSILLIFRFFKLFRFKNILWKIGILLMALVFLFGAGEEISWGQRIFNIESSQYFLENNAQGETNLHNMVVDGKKINKIIFSQLLTVVLVLYLIVAPFLYRKVKAIRNLADLFAVPIAKWHHTITFLIITLMVTLMPSERKWELYELAFGMIFLLIFLGPLNKKIYQPNIG